MKNLKRYLRVYVLPILIICAFYYLMGCFKAWSLDPGKFGYKTRGLLTLFTIFTTWFYILRTMVKQHKSNTYPYANPKE